MITLEAVRGRRAPVARLWRRAMARAICACSARSRAARPTRASDLDLLVDLEPGRSLIDLGALLVDLEAELGSPVDVVTEAGLAARTARARAARRRASVRDQRARLGDILEAVAAIRRHAGRGRDAFVADELIQVWIVHHLQIIGEAAARLRPERYGSRPPRPGPGSSACATSWCTATSGSISTRCGRWWSAISIRWRRRCGGCSTRAAGR